MGKHDRRFFANEYMDDRGAFQRLQAQVDTDPATLVDLYSSRAVHLLRSCSANAARLLSVACGPPSHRRDLVRLGLRPYSGELAGYGIALDRLAQTLTLIGTTTATTIAAIADLRCDYRLTPDERGGWAVDVDVDVDVDVRAPPRTSVQAAEYCRQTAANVLAICIGASEQIGDVRHSRTFLESDLGVRAVLMKDGRHPFQADLRAVADSVAIDDDDDDEVLYGRAGVLYALLYLIRRGGGGGEYGPAAAALARRIVSSGAERARRRESPFPLLYEWRGADYLGAAHGLAGILYVLLQAVDKADDDLRVRIESAARRSAQVMIARLQMPSGNFPPRLRPGEPADWLVQWCHGSPGVLALLCRVRQLDVDMDEDVRLSGAIRRALDDIWARGLLRKGVGLCHGIAGNGYAFLRDPGPGLDRRLMLARAAAFAEIAWAEVDDLFTRPDNPFSLYEGVAGLVCYLLDVVLALAGKPILGMPGFDV